MDVLKPYVALACAAFMVGFLGYWMLGRALAVEPATEAPAHHAPAAAVAPGVDPNPSKRI